MRPHSSSLIKFAIRPKNRPTGDANAKSSAHDLIATELRMKNKKPAKATPNKPP